MTEAWTHQFNSEADFLDFLKMRRENEELLAKVKYLEKAVDDYANDIVKKNETIGELRRASSPMECTGEPIKQLLEACMQLQDYLNETRYEHGKPVQLNTVGANSVLHNNLAKALFNAIDKENAALPLPVESGWIKELDQKFSHCFFGQNTSFNELVEFIKTKIK